MAFRHSSISLTHGTDLLQFNQPEDPDQYQYGRCAKEPNPDREEVRFKRQGEETDEEGKMS